MAGSLWVMETEDALDHTDHCHAPLINVSRNLQNGLIKDVLDRLQFVSVWYLDLLDMMVRRMTNCHCTTDNDLATTVRLAAGQATIHCCRDSF